MLHRQKHDLALRSFHLSVSWSQQSAQPGAHLSSQPPPQPPTSLPHHSAPTDCKFHAAALSSQTPSQSLISQSTVPDISFLLPVRPCGVKQDKTSKTERSSHKTVHHPYQHCGAVTLRWLAANSCGYSKEGPTIRNAVCSAWPHSSAYSNGALPAWTVLSSSKMHSWGNLPRGRLGL